MAPTEVFVLPDTGSFLRQRVAITKSFLGHRTIHVEGHSNPSRLAGKTAVWQWDENPNDGEGLFEFDKLTGFTSNPQLTAWNPVTKRQPFIYVDYVRLVLGPAVNWTVYMTDGLENGTVQTLDDVANDAEVVNGVGSTVMRITMHVPPCSRIRVITDAVTVANAFVELLVQPVVNPDTYLF